MVRAEDNRTALVGSRGMTAPSQIRLGQVLAVVLGRGGSKGLPGKNVRPLGGVPLLGWSCAAGLAASSVDRLVCSTDDSEIMAVARRFGAEVPFVRPSEFATDSATDFDVFGHVINWLAEHEGVLPELIIQLRPTTPFRDPAWIDQAVAMMLSDPGISSVRSVALAPLTPYKMWRCAENGQLLPLLELAGVAEPYNMPRQKLPPVYWHTGQLDVIRTDTILAGSMTGPKIQALPVPVDMAVDIDSLKDFQFAELVFDEYMPKSLRDWVVQDVQQ